MHWGIQLTTQDYPQMRSIKKKEILQVCCVDFTFLSWIARLNHKSSRERQLSQGSIPSTLETNATNLKLFSRCTLDVHRQKSCLLCKSKFHREHQIIHIPSLHLHPTSWGNWAQRQRFPFLTSHNYTQCARNSYFTWGLWFQQTHVSSRSFVS